MSKTMKKTVSMLLAVIMVFSLFAIVPFTASAATTYEITWKDDSYNTIDITEVEEGVVPTHAALVKAATIKSNYTFTGWYPVPVPATADKAYRAQFREDYIYYAVGDSIDFGSSTVVRGVNSSDPKIELSGTYTIASATFDSDNRRYNLELRSGDNTVELTASGNIEYENFAIYISNGVGTTNNPYRFKMTPLGTVIWKDEDGNILETDENVPEGSRPSFDGTYSKESESPEDYYYVTRWFNEYNGRIDTTPWPLSGLTGVYFDTGTGQKTYHGKIIKVKYLKPGAVYFTQDGIDFQDSYTMFEPGGSVLKRSGMRIITNLRLYTASTNRYQVALTSEDGMSTSYFYITADEYLGEKVAWKCVSGDGTQDNPYTFAFVPYGDVTWKLDADTVIDTTKVLYGDAPTHDVPVKPDEDNYTFTFTGWNDGTTTYAPAAALPEVTDDATYTATFSSAQYVASVTANGTTTKYTDFANAVNAWAPASAPDNSTLTLLADINYNPSFSVTGTKTLDLNGHGITGTGTIAIAAGGNTTLTDSNPEAVHYFDVQNGYAVNINNTSGEKSFTGGYLAGGTGDWGSAIQISGTLTMDGGTILGNTSNYSGAVRVHSNATFIMTGGQIIYNRCAAQRGGNDASLNAESNAVIKFSGNPVIKNNVNPAGKPANVMVRSTLAKKINVIGTLTDGAEIGITMQNNSGNDYTGAFTASSDIANNDASKFFSDNSNYIVGKNAAGQLVLGVPRTVTWKDDEGNTIDTTTVADGGVPTHDAPTKPADDTNTYTFAGWKNGTTTYAPGATLPEVTGDTTYTAQFTAKPKTLIAGHSLTLDGDIGINFYLDPSVAGKTVTQVTTNDLSYTFAWADGVNAKVNVAGQSGSTFKRVIKDGKDYIQVTCKVCAAEMSCRVNASFTLGNKSQSEFYSVRDYCDTILKTSNDALLVDLATKMLQYGAKAQTVFDINTIDPADSIVPETTDPVPADVTDEMINKAIAEEPDNDHKTADDMNDVASGLGAKWYATTLIYLSKNTLRHYFIKDTNEFNPNDYPASKSDYYYYVEVTDIPAAKLDKLQTFTAGNKTFKYSALDFVKGMLHSSASDDSKNLAKALYWYNKAANEYFG